MSTAPGRVSEVFYSLQGEGPSVGRPAVFLRLQGCDVGCAWCDTRYTWDPGLGEPLDLPAIERRIAAEFGACPLLVVTGGEPLQHPQLGDLLDWAATRFARVEIETSAVAPPPRTGSRFAYNASPKLPGVSPRWAATWEHVSAYLALPETTFKVVVRDLPDFTALIGLARRHGIPAERVAVLPEGLTDEAVRAHARELAEPCKRAGFRLSPRLHIWLWGARRGV
ncbi:MAG: 7-carboxy-7-deazaguanine synthase QueE [Planctomycetes bacterium]|nr:7-carboxy-7-deazaguanine synthase QueE [Planctomycetota bacterium]